MATHLTWDKERLLAFADGSAEKAFGPAYRPFDQGRFLARLPRPPYLMLDAVTETDLTPGKVRENAHITALWMREGTDWTFRQPGNLLPYSLLLEAALQPCGLMAAWMGASLQSDRSLYFRNLGGKLRFQAPALPGKLLETRARLTRFVKNGDLQLLFFDISCKQEGELLLSCETHFGFFTEEALKDQKGMKAPEGLELPPLPQEVLHDFSLPSPLPWPEEHPEGALSMVHRILSFEEKGGPAGLGKTVALMHLSPEDWYFYAHFKDDPVCPGSLGLEALLTTLRWTAGRIFGEAPRSFQLLPQTHTWTYRGQIRPHNRAMHCVIAITEKGKSPDEGLFCDGAVFCDGLCIYTVKNFGVGMGKG
jgi:3-hydroxymyristoyl/3-hydroxydecanoyl-(acyl carrier protein) dehydratase